MIRKILVCLALLIALVPLAPAGQAPTALDIRHLTQPRMDDLPVALRRLRTIRVLVPYSRTLYFVDKGRERGVTAETLREFERFVNRKLKTRIHPVTVVMIPVTRLQLIDDLLAGHGDIAAGNITVTPEREAVVAFSMPIYQDVREILVTGPGAPPIQNLDDLAGQEIAVKQSSSFHASLLAANARLAMDGKPAIDIRRLPEDLETEDILDMVNAGLLPMTVIDAHIGRLWAPVLKNLVLREDIVLRGDAIIAYAMRKENPRLRQLVDEFIADRLSKASQFDRNIHAYARRARQLANNRVGAEHERFKKTLELFRRYGQRYGFNPLMLAAQGFQESNLDQNARSRMGAIGVMQLLPSTGAEMEVGDIRKLEPNIHAGTKYLDMLMRKYFQNTELDAQNRALFAFASYNIGPNRMNRLRQEARKIGLNPNTWFDNVEIVASRRVGIEPILYVRNIYKYFVAYQLDQEGEERRRQALESLTPE